MYRSAAGREASSAARIGLHDILQKRSFVKVSRLFCVPRIDTTSIHIGVNGGEVTRTLIHTHTQLIKIMIIKPALQH